MLQITHHKDADWMMGGKDGGQCWKYIHGLVCFGCSIYSLCILKKEYHLFNAKSCQINVCKMNSQCMWILAFFGINILNVGEGHPHSEM